MSAKVMNRSAVSGSLIGALVLVVACASSESDPEGASGRAGSAGSGGSGAAGRGNVAGAGGTAGNSMAGTGGVAGSGCTYTDAELAAGAPTRDAANVGGAGGADATGVGGFECIPDIDVCFTPPVATSGLPFVKQAWAIGDEASVATAEVRAPKRGTVCMSGTNPHGGELALPVVQGDGTSPFASLAANVRDDPTPAELFHARWLGITDVSFKLEPPPGLAVGFFIAAAAPCSDFPVHGAPENDGNPFVIAASGTTTVTFADFVSLDPPLPFDSNAIFDLHFTVGSGPYDFCVSDLRFLDANGDDVTP